MILGYGQFNNESCIVSVKHLWNTTWKDIDSELSIYEIQIWKQVCIISFNNEHSQWELLDRGRYRLMDRWTLNG